MRIALILRLFYKNNPAISAYRSLSNQEVSSVRKDSNNFSSETMLSMKVLKTTDPNVISESVTLLERGGVISVPTDTVYGIAASALHTEAIERVYSIKQRSKVNPLAVCVGHVEDINKWAVNTVSTDLLTELLPGPVTLIFERRETLNPRLNPEKRTVGLRIPDSPFIVELARTFDNPIALTSANLSAEQSTLAVEEFKSLWSLLDLVVDGGKIGQENEQEAEASRSGSTIVDLSISGFYHIVRSGCALSSTIERLQKYGLKELSS